MTEFIPFPKMARLSRECMITEKIDGTNAQIVIYDPALNTDAEEGFTSARDAGGKVWNIKAASRNRFISPYADNYGFARWVWENAEELVKLGEGRHFGEWYGSGIQRGYSLKEKRFALFNAARWNEEPVPACCEVVPILYRGIFTTNAVEDACATLRAQGSFAARGFMNPEGVIVFHEAARVGFKKTLENDESPKTLVR